MNLCLFFLQARSRTTSTPNAPFVVLGIACSLHLNRSVIDASCKNMESNNASREDDAVAAIEPQSSNSIAVVSETQHSNSIVLTSESQSASSTAIAFDTCQDLYEQLVSLLGQDTSPVASVSQASVVEVRDGLSKFAIWGSQSGCARDVKLPVSLDNSLRSDPELESTVLDILQLLQEDLDRGMWFSMCVSASCLVLTTCST